MNKRIYKEIYNSDFLNENFEIKHNGHSKCLKIKTKKKIYTFILSPNYPFEKPEFIINDTIKYSDFVRLKNKELRNIVYKYNLKCPCCHTILCNWEPSRLMIDLIVEYKQYLKKYKEIFYIYLFHKSMRKIDKYEDIKKYIFSYIKN